MWLRYLFVYGNQEGLFLGRAVPRAWLAGGTPIGLEKVQTRWGRASLRFVSGPAPDTITAKVELALQRKPPRTIVRFRHPGGKPIRSVQVNGREHRAFDAERQDVDITGLEGALEVTARF
jgi:hypothetical protein